MILIPIIFLILGCVGLIYGAKFTVIGLENFALRLGVSQLLIGLTILSIGTSLPEIAVSVMGGIDKVLGIETNLDGIVIGNKVGSFFTQITLILGILGLYQGIFISKWKLTREGLMLFISVLIFLLCAIDGNISQIEALILMISYIIYLIFIIYSEKKIEHRQKEIKDFIAKRDGLELEKLDEGKKKEDLEHSYWKDILFVIVGLLILIGGAELTLLSAHEIAKEFNIPQNIVGIFIIGLETSLPELVADISALKRDSAGIAVGDILGSNICDILFATASGSIIVSFNVPFVLIIFDIPFLFLTIGIVIYFLWTKNMLNRKEALGLIFLYIFYTILKLLFFRI